ncbi:hypothetical protein JR316_0009676 [Psilocybe cubensis]|uniref:Uncharacterized protein n=1 Tax=Psilocybe cubensis TaxID=181762 RepID=A0ACB8GPH9_PSICU|nr:hypothetical protein JR316_0009676 [Psilocybe cubensis]KAH9477463.1 hypothetical protein JR316_0009676 [Psilocybe cubensis]
MTSATFQDPQVFFQDFQPITCEPVNITWDFSGANNPIDLTVTNNDVAQDTPPPSLTSSHTRRPNTFTNDRRAVPTGVNDPILSVTTEIASGIDPTLETYTWPLVNIPQGWYVFSASMPGYGGGYTTTSNPIFVHKGEDTSCLSTTSSSSSSSASSTGSSTTTNPPSTSNTALPIIGASSHTSVGTIVGVSVAAIALIGMVITAWLCLLRRGRKSSVLGDGQASSGRWNGLSSVDSRVLTNSGRPLSRHQGRGGTVGSIPGESEDAIGAEKNSVYSKNPFESSGVALSTLPVLQQQPTTRNKVASRTYSASSSSSNVFSTNEYVTAPPGRRPSIQDSIGRQSLDSSNTYPPTSPISPHARSSSQFMPSSSLSRSQSITSNTHQTSPSQSTSSHVLMYQQPSSPLDPSSPVSPSNDANKQARRQSFGGKKRKPVPAYDPSQDPLSPSLAPSPIPPPSPSPDHLMNSTNAGGHYTTRNHAGRDFSQPQLVHKSSFGPGGVEGKPLHYLIPDMPMPVKD